jgi:uncharacterized protein
MSSEPAAPPGSAGARPPGAPTWSGTGADVATPAPFPVPSGPRRLHPRQVQVWRVGSAIGALVLVGLVAAAETVLRMVDGVSLPWPWPAATVVVLVAMGAAAWVVPRLAWERWRYELAEETLELRRGVVVHGHTAIPYFRVQHIDITRSPVERALGLSQLVVRTAAAATDATIPGVAAADAEALRDVILARTGRDDAV